MFLVVVLKLLTGSNSDMRHEILFIANSILSHRVLFDLFVNTHYLFIKMYSLQICHGC